MGLNNISDLYYCVLYPFLSKLGGGVWGIYTCFQLFQLRSLLCLKTILNFRAMAACDIKVRTRLSKIIYMYGFMKTVLKNLPPITHISPFFHYSIWPPPSHVKLRAKNR